MQFNIGDVIKAKYPSGGNGELREVFGEVVDMGVSSKGDSYITVIDDMKGGRYTRMTETKIATIKVS